MTLRKWRLLSIVAALMAGVLAGVLVVVYAPFFAQGLGLWAELIVASITYPAMHLIAIGGAHAMALWRPGITAFAVFTAVVLLLLTGVALTSRGPGENFGF